MGQTGITCLQIGPAQGDKHGKDSMALQRCPIPTLEIWARVTLRVKVFAEVIKLRSLKYGGCSGFLGEWGGACHCTSTSQAEREAEVSKVPATPTLKMRMGPLAKKCGRR